MNFSKAERRRRAKRADHARKFIDREKQRAAVRLVGLANAASGQLASVTTAATRAKGGKKGGPKVGQMMLIRGVVGKWSVMLHTRWHVNRKQKNKKCPHCRLNFRRKAAQE
jgi:hypothetical protein